MKKAQVAMESIMIYGLAILVVMLAIGALMYFDVLDLGGLLPDRCEVKGVALTCENYAVNPTQVMLEIRNNLGKNINMASVKVSGESGTDMELMWNCPEKAVTAIIVNGDKTLLTLDGCDIKIPAGKKITGVIKLSYNVIGSAVPMTAFGDIRTTVQQ